MIESKLNSLDFMRGLAILGVVCFHVFVVFDPGSPGISFIAPLGAYGVQLFFIVSAISMCLMWHRRADEDQATARFYIRRFWRIAPPFWLAIIGYLLLDGTGPSYWSSGHFGWRQIAMTATFLHGFWPDTINMVVPGGWSIAVEMTFYVCFPFIIRWKASAIVFVAAAFALYLANIAIITPAYSMLLENYQRPDLLWTFFYFQFFNQCPIFLIGIALYKSSLKQDTSLSKPILLLVIAAWLWIAFNSDDPFNHSKLSFWFSVAVLSGFAWVCLQREFSFPLINRMGELSYSIYLSHFAIVEFVAYVFRALSFDLNSVSGFFVALAATLSLCYIAGAVLRATVERASYVATTLSLNYLSKRSLKLSF